MGCCASTGAAVPTLAQQASSPRDLRRLPKAHLHLHFSSCIARRETLEELASGPDWPARAEKALAEAESEAAEAEAAGLQLRAAKYRRRADLLSASDLVIAAFGQPPPARDCDDMAVLADVSRLDKETAQPGARGVWDAQWVGKSLVDSLERTDRPPGSGMRRLLRELYEDSAAEGVRWTELAAQLSVKNGKVKDDAAAEWRELLQEWKLLETEYDGRVGVRFVVNCPKTEDDAKALVAFLESDDRARAAVVGVGQWGAEKLATALQGSYDVCAAAGLALSCVHAGENRLQAACPSGAELDEAILSSYDGPANVRAAMDLPGIRRVGHGIEVAKDEGLMAELARRREGQAANAVCLEVCLMSNRRLGYCEPGLANHPLPRMLAAGVPCCLAADDPAFFGARTAHGLHREFIAARHILGLTDEQLAGCARASFKFASCPEEVRAAALAEIDSWIASADEH